jgi:hypothetical protein
MNITRSLSLILALVFSCHGEIFISSTNQVNSLTISSNEALFISVARQSRDSNGFASDFKTYIRIAGVDLPFIFEDAEGAAIAGPAELKFNLNTTNLAPALISFERVQGSAIRSLYVTNSAAQPPPTIPTVIVPAGRTCHFFRPIGDDNVFVTVISGTNTVPNLDLNGGEEFAGPVSLLHGTSSYFICRRVRIRGVSFEVSAGAPRQPEGLPDISRGLSASDTPGTRLKTKRTLEGCQNCPPPASHGIRPANRLSRTHPVFDPETEPRLDCSLIYELSRFVRHRGVLAPLRGAGDGCVGRPGVSSLRSSTPG